MAEIVGANSNYEQFKKRRNDEKLARQQRIQDRLKAIKLNKITDVVKQKIELKENKVFVVGKVERTQKLSIHQKCKPLVMANPKKDTLTVKPISTIPSVNGAKSRGLKPQNSQTVSMGSETVKRKSPRTNNIKINTKTDQGNKRKEQLEQWRKNKMLGESQKQCKDTNVQSKATASKISPSKKPKLIVKRNSIKPVGNINNKISASQITVKRKPDDYHKRKMNVTTASTSAATKSNIEVIQNKSTILRMNAIKRESMSRKFLQSRKSTTLNRQSIKLPMKSDLKMNDHKPPEKKTMDATSMKAQPPSSLSLSSSVSYTIDVMNPMMKRRRTTMFKVPPPREDLSRSIMKEKLNEWLNVQGKSPSTYKRHMCCYGLHQNSPLITKSKRSTRTVPLQASQVFCNNNNINNDTNKHDNNNNNTNVTVNNDATNTVTKSCAAPSSERKFSNKGKRILGEVENKNIFRSSDIFYLCKEIKEHLNRTSFMLQNNSIITNDDNNNTNTIEHANKSTNKSTTTTTTTDNCINDNINIIRNICESDGVDGDDDNGGVFSETPCKKCYVITPVRRSTRKSCFTIPPSRMDHEIIVESVDELPVETKQHSIFKSNKRITMFEMKADGNDDGDDNDHHDDPDDDDDNLGGGDDAKKQLGFDDN